MIKGIRNEKWFRQKIYSGGVGRTYGGDIDNFYTGYYRDRIIFWEAKHKNADRDYSGPQAFYLKNLVNNLINLEVVLIWVEHESDDDIIQLKDTKPVACYYKKAGETQGKLYTSLKDGITVHDFAAWADRKGKYHDATMSL